jgi:hypothetical protein
MEKIKLERFIGKYTLGGAVESVTWTSTGNKLSTKVQTKDKNAGGEITLLDSDGVPHGLFSVYETKKLKAMLSVVGDDITITANVQNSAPKSLEFSSDRTRAVFVLADPSIIPDAPVLTKMPPFDITIELDDKFMSTFLRAKAALSDSDTFVVKGGDASDAAHVILGYSGKNTNRVTITATATGTNFDIEPIKFSSLYLKEIFLANKEVIGGTMAVSSRGLCVITLNSTEYKSSYYLVKVNDTDDI